MELYSFIRKKNPRDSNVFENYEGQYKFVDPLQQFWRKLGGINETKVNCAITTVCPIFWKQSLQKKNPKQSNCAVH